jgi:hypothetical protein
MDELLSFIPSPETNPNKRDLKELLLCRRQQLLKHLATASFATIAPFLSLARAPDIDANVGLTMNTKVLTAKSFCQDSYTVNRLYTVTDVDSLHNHRNIENTLYIFCNFSCQVFEPFISITRDNKGTQVFAYVNDKELILADQIEGSDEKILEALKEKAQNEKMCSLVRFIDLTEQALQQAVNGKEVTHNEGI